MRGGSGRGRGAVQISPKKVKQMMRQLGVNMEEISDVEEVVIKTADVDIVFKDATVAVTEVQGTKTYQITGTAEERAKSKEKSIPVPPVPASEDIELVMEKAGCSEEEAKTALIATKGDLAEAISQLCPDSE
jgi:nascent polypeptide-associated complex subunit alpha